LGRPPGAELSLETTDPVRVDQPGSSGNIGQSEK
jgi:hypothetical protein